MFFALGLTNAWRNRGRTALGTVSRTPAMIFSQHLRVSGLPRWRSCHEADVLHDTKAFFPSCGL